MARNRDPLALSPHWHVDCRIEADLPEDNIVGTRFLINLLFTAVGTGALLFAGWLGYLNFSLRYQIRDWEQRIKDNRAEVLDIQRMAREYAVEAQKIDQAYTLVRPQLFVSGLIADLGRTRPDSVVIDLIDWSESGIVMRGSLREAGEKATLTLGNYVKTLQRDPKFTAIFQEKDIQLANLDRGAAGDMIKFEITLKLKPLPKL